jgi:hypothetical protein
MTWTEWNQSKAAYQDPREGLRRDTEQEPVRIDTSGPTWTSASFILLCPIWSRYRLTDFVW